MSERSLFYPRPLTGQGTGQVQSLQSYLEHLALSHNMKPRVLLETLLGAYPLDSFQGAEAQSLGDQSSAIDTLSTITYLASTKGCVHAARRNVDIGGSDRESLSVTRIEGSRRGYLRLEKLSMVCFIYL